MNIYITTADVETIKGVDWYGTGDPDQAVLEANVWMQAYGVPVIDPTPDDVLQAGAILAVEAANGRLYADQSANIKRKMVKADTVQTETEYQDYSYSSSGAITLAKALLASYVTSSVFGAGVIMLKRL